MTADIELNEMLKDPAAKTAIELAAAEQKKTDDAATEAKRQKQAAGQLRILKQSLQNGGNPDEIKKQLKKIIDAKFGGTTESDARELLKSMETP